MYERQIREQHRKLVQRQRRQYRKLREDYYARQQAEAVMRRIDEAMDHAIAQDSERDARSR